MSEGLSGWNVYQLGQLIDRGSAELQTGPFGTMLNSSEYTVTGTPVIAVQDIGENKLRHHKFVYVNETTVKRLSRYKVKKGDIIVSPMTTADMMPALKRAGAIVTDEGGVICHAAIVSRELGKPCLIATKAATKLFKDGDLLEVDVYAGVVKKAK